MPWSMAIEAQRARLGRRKFGSNILCVFFCVLVGGFVPGFVLVWHKKTPLGNFTYQYPLFNTEKLGLLPSCALE